MANYTEEISKRRTFAIISHPDAGKTTLTEKFLLYGGAINLAGSVKGKATARHAVSDWMEIEKERGISVTSSVLQFEYDGFCINILDTPGHQDFSEDTYRTLMAADSAVMVIDASKGVEAQTRKLFKVCGMRGIPIFTFINKMDRDANDTFELLDEIEKEDLIEENIYGVGNEQTARPHVLIGIQTDTDIFQNQHLFEVTTVHSTDLLLGFFIEKEPEIVFIDNNLKGSISVFDLIEEIRKRSADTPIIVTADYAVRPLHKKVRQFGGQYLLTNPLSLRKVNVMIKKYLK